ncbi:MAG TPA: hypothetical protein VJ761_15415 [Ktedonobacteraceae bacterium]|nr:hypothetical protein [Ktedonobacteraceae bacterium]
MDPVTLILTALTTGAAASAKDVTGQAVKDAYNGLKTLIQHKLAGKPDAEMALAQHEKKPEVWKAPLEDSLKEAGVAQDQEIIAAAQHLMTLVQPQQMGLGKYNIQNTGTVQGQVIGDAANVTQQFGKPPKE